MYKHIIERIKFDPKVFISTPIQKLILVTSCVFFLAKITFSQVEPRLVLPVGHTDYVYSAVFSADGKLALTSSWDKTARIYEVASGKELQVLSGHTDGVNSAVFSADGRLALTSSLDKTARIYEVASGKELQV